MRDKLYKRLLDRGYLSRFLDKIFPSVSFIRTKYLTHGDLVKKVGEAPPALFVPSDYTNNNLVNLRIIVADEFNKHKHRDNTVSHIFGESGPRVVYLKGNSLQRYYSQLKALIIMFFCFRLFTFFLSSVCCAARFSFFDLVGRIASPSGSWCLLAL